MIAGYKQISLWKATGFLLFLTLSVFHSSPAMTDRLPGKEEAHVVFLISDDPNNYEATRTIPVFAESLRREQGFKVTVLLGEGDRSAFRFPGLEVVSDADLIVVFCRRVALTSEQLDLLKNYLRKGKPLVGIRTANHAFTALGEIAAGHDAWPGFVTNILGCENRGYGPQELGTDVSIVPSQKKHPILKGFKPERWHADGSTYLVAPLLDEKATVLVTGKVNDKVEPIAWTRYTADKSRVFYTSLGYPSDFDKPQFNNLLVNAIYWALDIKKR